MSFVGWLIWAALLLGAALVAGITGTTTAMTVGIPVVLALMTVYIPLSRTSRVHAFTLKHRHLAIFFEGTIVVVLWTFVQLAWPVQLSQIPVLVVIVLVTLSVLLRYAIRELGAEVQQSSPPS